MGELSKEIAAYDKIRSGLETDHPGEWVLVHDEQLVDLFETFEAAADAAVKQFGRGPYLIRQVGAPAITLSAVVMYNVHNAVATGLRQ
jgi:hypothetical protein